MSASASDSCTRCGKHAASGCARCSAPYCSKLCYDADWLSGHKFKCASVGAAPSVMPPPPGITPTPVPTKPGVEPPLVVPGPRPTPKPGTDPYVFGGVDLNWLRGKTHVELYDYTKSPAPVRFLYDTGLKNIVAVQAFEREHKAREAPPHIPPLRRKEIVDPILRSQTGQMRGYMSGVVEEIESIRTAFNATGDALWEMFALNNATNDQYQRAYNVLLSAQAAMLDVQRMTDVFTSRGTAIRSLHTNLAQQMFEVATEVADDGTDKPFLVQNVGALAGRMFLDTMFEDDGAMANAVLDELERRGDERAARISEMDPQSVVDQALAAAREALQRRGHIISDKDRAFMESLLATVEAQGKERASDSMDTGFKVAQRGVDRTRMIVYALAVLYVVSVVIDALYGDGSISRSTGFLAGAAAAAASARGAAQVAPRDIASAALDNPPVPPHHQNNLVDNGDGEGADERRRRTKAVLRSLYGRAAGMADATGGRIGIHAGTGIPIVNDVLDAAAKEAEFAQRDVHERLRMMEGLQKGAVDNAERAAGTFRTVRERRDVEARVAELVGQGEKGSEEAFAQAVQEFQQRDWDMLVEHLTEAVTPMFSNWRGVEDPDANDSTEVAVQAPDRETATDMVLRRFEDDFGAIAAQTPDGKRVVREVVDAVLENWDALSQATQRRRDVDRNLSPNEKTMRDETVHATSQLHESLLAEGRTAASSIQALAKTREFLSEQGDSVQNHYRRVDEANFVSAQAEAARLAAELLSETSDTPSDANTNARIDEKYVIMKEVADARAEDQVLATASGYEILAPGSEDEGYLMLIWRSLFGMMDRVDMARLHIAMQYEELTDWKFSINNTPGYFETSLAAIATTLASTKTTLNTAYHLAKFGASAMRIQSLERASDAMTTATGDSNDAVTARSGVYAAMTSTVSTARADNVPSVARAAQFLCRSLFVLNIKNLARTAWRIGGWALGTVSMGEGLAAGVIAATSLLMMREHVLSFTGVVFNLDTYLTRMAIRTFLRVFAHNSQGRTADLAERMRDEAFSAGIPSMQEAFTRGGEWERIKRAVVAKGGVSQVDLARLDAWASATFSALNLLTSWLLIPKMIQKTRELALRAVITQAGAHRVFTSSMALQHTDQIPPVTHMDEIARIAALNIRGPRREGYLAALDRIGARLASTAQSAQLPIIQTERLVADSTFAYAEGAAALEHITQQIDRTTRLRRARRGIVEATDIIGRFMVGTSEGVQSGQEFARALAQAANNV